MQQTTTQSVAGPPTNAIFLNEAYLTFNEDCTQCGMCVKVCPVGAIDYRRGVIQR